MAKTQLKLKDVILNTAGQVIEIEVFDVEKREGFKMGRIEDIHGDVKEVDIKMSDGQRITGKVNLTKYRRVSDLLMYGKQFQTITDAIVDGVKKDVYFLNKNFVVGIEEK